jgi:hypothetical protein
MTLQEAIERAREEALRRGFTWIEPVRASHERSLPLVGRRQIHVRSNAESLGANVLAIFDASTGNLERITFLAR